MIVIVTLRAPETLHSPETETQMTVLSGLSYCLTAIGGSHSQWTLMAILSHSSHPPLISPKIIFKSTPFQSI